VFVLQSGRPGVLPLEMGVGLGGHAALRRLEQATGGASAPDRTARPLMEAMVEEATVKVLSLTQAPPRREIRKK
jgi:hypothetical protein